MKQCINNNLNIFFIALMLLPMNAAWALIPEPDNLLYGTVTLDGRQLTAADKNVSIVVKYAGSEIASYTMGDDPSMLNKYLLEISGDSILQRNSNATRSGDVLSLYYKVGTSITKTDELLVNKRGTTTELNIQLSSEDIVAGPNPNDIDTDGDGISDVYEVAHGLNPFDNFDSTVDANGNIVDADGDGKSNYQEYLDGTDLNVDDNPPQLIPPISKTFSSTGLFTPVNLGVATAFDFKDGILNAMHDGHGVYTPGEHIVVWTVADEAGNTTTKNQHIKVIPLVNFYPNQWVAEGNTVTIVAELNGVALTYPVTIPYTVSGTASEIDHDLMDGEIVIAGGLVGSSDFTILNDAIADEGLESIIVTMGVPSNAVSGNKSIFTAQIVEGNIAPTVSLKSEQGGDQRNLIIAAGTTVTITSTVSDNNLGDVHQYDWSMTDSSLIDIDGDVTDDHFLIDPSSLQEGTYIISLTVTDLASASSSTDLILSVVSSLPVMFSIDTDNDGLFDDEEGLADKNQNAIPDYLDAQSQGHLLRGDASVPDQYLLETEFGHSLSLGRTAINSASIDPIVTAEDVNTTYNLSLNVDHYMGGLYEFWIEGLSKPGDSVRIVLPLLSQIIDGAGYKQLEMSPEATWVSFVENDKNILYSAQGSPGYCPSPGDTTYTPGLTAGNWCIMLMIEDGGPNDADANVNQRVVSLSGAPSLSQSDIDMEISNENSGGGSFNPLFLLFTLFFSLVKGLRNRHIQGLKT